MMVGEPRIGFPVSAAGMADIQEVSGLLTRAEGVTRRPTDVARNAVAFYCAQVRACLSCSSGILCPIHGTKAIRPVLSEKEETVSPEDFRLVVASYQAAFAEARGARPPFGNREGAAVKTLLQKMTAAEAVKVIAAAYTDSWGRKNATIITIANDPAKWMGDRHAFNANSLQKDSGFQGGKEIR